MTKHCSWSDDEIERLGMYIDFGYSAAMAAERLDRTRNACLGKANRLGWSFSRPGEDRTVPKRAPRAGPSGMCWNVWVPFDVEAKVKEYAKDAGMSVSGAMRELISIGLLSLEDDA